MPPATESIESPVEECLTPEQLVVANIEVLMKARGVTRAELAKRLNDLGFTAWRHEKTIRNLFDGKRSIKVDELFGFAAALTTTVLALTSLDTQRAVDTGLVDLEVNVCLGPSITERLHYLSLWWGIPGTGIPEVSLDWASWLPGQAPEWTSNRIRAAEWLIEQYQLLDLEIPAKAHDLTTDQLTDMTLRLRDVILDEGAE